MQRITLGQFLEHSMVYERTPVNINPGLRRGVWISWLAIGILGALYHFLPNGNYLRELQFFRWTKGWLANPWDFVNDYRVFLVLSCSIVFCMTIGLIFATHALHTAEISLHILIFLPVIFVALNIPFIAILILPIITNLILWILLFILLLAGGAILLFTLFRAIFQ